MGFWDFFKSDGQGQVGRQVARKVEVPRTLTAELLDKIVAPAVCSKTRAKLAGQLFTAYAC